jgi:hypothetical protein
MVHAYEQSGYRDGELTAWLNSSGVVSTLFTTALLAMAICTTIGFKSEPAVALQTGSSCGVAVAQAGAVTSSLDLPAVAACTPKYRPRPVRYP